MKLLRRPYLLIALSGLAFGVCLSESTSAGSLLFLQEVERVFEKNSPLHPEPAEVIEIKAMKKAIKLREKFVGGDDWLRGATFKVKNVSGKEIVYLELALNFPETASLGNEMEYRIKLGRRPKGFTNPFEPLSVKPNEELTIPLTEKGYEELARFLNPGLPIASIHRVSDNRLYCLR